MKNKLQLLEDYLASQPNLVREPNQPIDLKYYKSITEYNDFMDTKENMEKKNDSTSTS